MALNRCISFEGNTTIVADDPAIATFHNVVYEPASWVLYDHGRKAITGSAYFRGPKPELVAGQYTTATEPGRIGHEAPDDCYFFVGPLHMHYGHFLLASLARFWAWSRTRYPGIKLLTYGDPRASAALTPFMAPILAALGASYDDLVSFQHVTRIRSVVVAWPSFEESNFAHHAFARMGRQIGEALLTGTTASPSDTPVYLARWELAKGVHRLVNEQDFAAVIAAAGVDIVFPERLDIVQQVRLFTDRRTIVGQGGSAFHTAALVGARRKMLTLQYGPVFLSNQVLLDRACGHDALYLYSPDGMTQRPAEPEFALNFALVDPRQAAEDVLRILSPFMGAKPLTRDQERSAFGAADEAAENGVPRPNLALGAKTRQSSVDVFSRGLSPSEDSAGAVCGFCTGSYQFHTAIDDGPWWDVDLGGLVAVQEIRLFNRLDAGRERAASFVLSMSDDGIDWTPVLEHRSDHAFGGLDGHPFVWRATAARVTRFVRITIPGTTCIHLDQVVIYGPPSPQRNA